MKSRMNLNLTFTLMLLAIVVAFLALGWLGNRYRAAGAQLSRIEIELNAALNEWNSLMGAAKSLGLSEEPIDTLLSRLTDKRKAMGEAWLRFSGSIEALKGDSVLSLAANDLRDAMSPAQELLSELQGGFETLRQTERGDLLFREGRSFAGSVPYLFDAKDPDEAFFEIQRIRGLIRVIDVYSVNFEMSERNVRQLIAERASGITRENHMAQLGISIVIFILLGLFLLNIFRMNILLQNMVAARTAELHTSNEELKKTLGDLDSAQAAMLVSGKMAAVGRVTATIAHELNSPLGAIRSSAGFLLESSRESAARSFQFYRQLPEPEADFFSRLYLRAALNAVQLESRADRLRRRATIHELEARGVVPVEIVADLLEMVDAPELQSELYGYLDRGKSELVVQVALLVSRVKATAVICNAADRASLTISSLANYTRNVDSQQAGPHYPAREIKAILNLYEEKMRAAVIVALSVEAADGVMGYGDGLFQVWNHLIVNALQSMEYHGRLEIGIAREAGELRIAIADNGPGIPQELHGMIFEPFFTSKKSGEGIGLGLYLSRQIVQQHGGRINFTSVPGKTRFVVHLPIFPGLT